MIVVFSLFFENLPCFILNSEHWLYSSDKLFIQRELCWILELWMNYWTWNICFYLRIIEDITGLMLRLRSQLWSWPWPWWWQRQWWCCLLPGRSWTIQNPYPLSWAPTSTIPCPRESFFQSTGPLSFSWISALSWMPWPDHNPFNCFSLCRSPSWQYRHTRSRSGLPTPALLNEYLIYY